MRYSRQELVLGKENQAKLEKSKVAIVGLGALGSVAAELLVRAGVCLTLIDRDIVEETNLQRQLLYDESDIDSFKVGAAKKRLSKINSSVSLTTHMTDLNHKNLALLEGHDLVLDCTDNLYTRFLLDEYCFKEKLTWIYAGVIKEQGNVLVVPADGARFSCLFSETEGLETCDTAGVLNTASVLIASLQVNEALKVLVGSFLDQVLLRVDLSSLHFTHIKVKKNEKNSLFSGEFAYLSGKKEKRSLSYQCSDLYTYFLDDVDLDSLHQKLSAIGDVKKHEHCIFFENVTVFDNGRVLIKAKTQEEAKSALSKYLGV